MSTLNQPHIYDEPSDRWPVEFRCSYPEGDEVTSAHMAAAAALALTTDEGSGDTIWVVTDRQTGEVVQMEQDEFQEIYIP